MRECQTREWIDVRPYWSRELMSSPRASRKTVISCEAGKCMSLDSKAELRRQAPTSQRATASGPPQRPPTR